MKLLSAPRQPFVGLALMAAMGIIAAEIIPLPSVAVTAAVIILAVCILTVARWPRLLAWAEELQKRGIKLFRQDETGAVTLRFHHDSWEAQSHVTGETFRSANQ